MSRLVFAALRVILVRVTYEMDFAHPTVRLLKDLQRRHHDRVATIDFAAQLAIIHAA